MAALLLASLLASTPVVVQCPVSCTTASAFAAGGLSALEVRCDGHRVRVRLDFPGGHVVSREVPQTADGCRSLPAVVRLLAAPFVVERAPTAVPLPEARVDGTAGSSVARDGGLEAVRGSKREVGSARDGGASGGATTALASTNGASALNPTSTGPEVSPGPPVNPKSTGREASPTPPARTVSAVGADPRSTGREASGSVMPRSSVGADRSSASTNGLLGEASLNPASITRERSLTGSTNGVAALNPASTAREASPTPPARTESSVGADPRSTSTNGATALNPTSTAQETSPGLPVTPPSSAAADPRSASTNDAAALNPTSTAREASGLTVMPPSSVGADRSSASTNGSRERSLTGSTNGAPSLNATSTARDPHDASRTGEPGAQLADAEPRSASTDALVVETASLQRDHPRTPVFLSADVGGALQVGTLAALFRARVTLSTFTHVAFFAEGGFSSHSSTAVGTATADTVMQQGALGALVSWRDARVGGPQLALDVGLEHVSATQAQHDEGVGVVFGARAEWVQPFAFGLFGRASLGVDARPAPWSVQVAGVTAVAAGNASFVAGLALGFSPSILWGW